MKLAKREMRKIEDVVNDVVAAMPSEKNKEVRLRLKPMSYCTSFNSF